MTISARPANHLYKAETEWSMSGLRRGSALPMVATKVSSWLWKKGHVCKIESKYRGTSQKRTSQIASPHLWKTKDPKLLITNKFCKSQPSKIREKCRSTPRLLSKAMTRRIQRVSIRPRNPISSLKTISSCYRFRPNTALIRKVIAARLLKYLSFAWFRTEIQ